MNARNGGQSAHGQNLTRMVACRLRIASADSRQAELRAFQCRDPAIEYRMIQQVGGVDAGVEIEALAGPERALHAAVETELVRPGDGVSAGSAPGAGCGRRVGGSIDVRAILSALYWRAGEAGAQWAEPASAWDGGGEERRFRQAGSDIQLRQQRPLLQHARPRQPPSSVPPSSPWPVVYCACRLSRWR